MEIVLSKKEGLESGTDLLEPLMRFVWTDCPIGRKSTVSMTLEQQALINHAANIILPNMARVEDFTRRVPVLMHKAAILLQG